MQALVWLVLLATGGVRGQQAVSYQNFRASHGQGHPTYRSDGSWSQSFGGGPRVGLGRTRFGGSFGFAPHHFSPRPAFLPPRPLYDAPPSSGFVSPGAAFPPPPPSLPDQSYNNDLPLPHPGPSPTPQPLGEAQTLQASFRGASDYPRSSSYQSQSSGSYRDDGNFQSYDSPNGVYSQSPTPTPQSDYISSDYTRGPASDLGPTSKSVLQSDIPSDPTPPNSNFGPDPGVSSLHHEPSPIGTPSNYGSNSRGQSDYPSNTRGSDFISSPAPNSAGPSSDFGRGPTSSFGPEARSPSPTFATDDRGLSSTFASEERGPSSSFVTDGRGPSSSFASDGRGPSSGFVSDGRGPSSGFASGGRGPSSDFASDGRGPSSGFASNGRGPSSGLASDGRGPSSSFASDGRGPSPGFSSGGRGSSSGFASGERGPSSSLASDGRGPSPTFSSEGRGPPSDLKGPSRVPSSDYPSDGRRYNNVEGRPSFDNRRGPHNHEHSTNTYDRPINSPLQNRGPQTFQNKASHGPGKPLVQTGFKPLAPPDRGPHSHSGQRGAPRLRQNNFPTDKKRPNLSNEEGGQSFESDFQSTELGSQSFEADLPDFPSDESYFNSQEGYGSFESGGGKGGFTSNERKGSYEADNRKNFKEKGFAERDSSYESDERAQSGERSEVSPAPQANHRSDGPLGDIAEEKSLEIPDKKPFLDEKKEYPLERKSPSPYPATNRPLHPDKKASFAVEKVVPYDGSYSFLPALRRGLGPIHRRAPFTSRIFKRKPTGEKIASFQRPVTGQKSLSSKKEEKDTSD